MPFAPFIVNRKPAPGIFVQETSLVSPIHKIRRIDNNGVIREKVLDQQKSLMASKAEAKRIKDAHFKRMTSKLVSGEKPRTEEEKVKSNADTEARRKADMYARIAEGRLANPVVDAPAPIRVVEAVVAAAAVKPVKKTAIIKKRAPSMRLMLYDNPYGRRYTNSRTSFRPTPRR